MDMVATTHPPSELCPRCAQIDIHSRWGFSHHNFRQLEDSASNLQCPLCKLFFEPFRSTGIFDTDSTSDITILPRSGKLGYRFYGEREHLYEIVKTRESSITDTSNERCDSVQINTDFRLANTIPLADQNIAMVNQWLRSCSMEHDHCKQKPGFTSPTRLLEIAGSQLRLISPLGKNFRYTILSHCWGVKNSLVTTESTIALFHQKIDWSAVPATFKDAITTSRKLDVEYLWIDSLCIIQDSTADWERECQNMGDYYKNAYLTISALDSPGSDTGFLHPRKSSAVKLSTSNSWIRPAGRVSNIIFRESYLNQRGWALQERLLSTRVLHFSRDELLWECQSCSATETSSIEYHEPVDCSLLVSSEGQDFKRAALNFGPNPYSLSDGALAAWYRVVKQYSRRSLTYESDRLPAISGIARSFAQRTEFTYLAGLWQQDPHGLVWCIDGPGNRISHQSTLRKNTQAVDIRCPSWSWAKMKHSVSWRFYEQNRAGSSGEAKILQSKIVSKSGDPYGAIQTAELELEASVLDVQCIPSYSRTPRYIPKFYKPPPNYDGDQEWNRHVAYREGLTLNIYRNRVMIGTGCYDDPELYKAMIDCTAVYIAKRTYKTSGITVKYFLLVQRPSPESEAWERIGIGMTRDTAFREHMQEPEYFEKVFEGQPKEIIKLR